MIENIQWLLLCGTWIGPTVYAYTLQKKISRNEGKLNVLSTAYNSALELILVEKQRREEHTKALKRLTDPFSIEEDMERGARTREMYDANRTTLPREDAGPPAKIYSPKLRANVPRGNYKRPQG